MVPSPSMVLIWTSTGLVKTSSGTLANAPVHDISTISGRQSAAAVTATLGIGSGRCCRLIGTNLGGGQAANPPGHRTHPHVDYFSMAIEVWPRRDRQSITPNHSTSANSTTRAAVMITSLVGIFIDPAFA